MRFVAICLNFNLAIMLYELKKNINLIAEIICTDAVYFSLHSPEASSYYYCETLLFMVS